jgi:hypothetical protein
MRGRLFLGGVRNKTPIDTVLDVLSVVVMDCPGEALSKWRTGLDRAVAQAGVRSAPVNPAPATREDVRARWGLEPHQVAATQRFMQTMGGV